MHISQTMAVLENLRFQSVIWTRSCILEAWAGSSDTIMFAYYHNIVLYSRTATPHGWLYIIRKIFAHIHMEASAMQSIAKPHDEPTHTCKAAHTIHVPGSRLLGKLISVVLLLVGSIQDLGHFKYLLI